MSRLFLAFVAAAAVALASAAADAKVLIEIDKSAQRMVVSVDGVTRHTWPVSTGRAGRDTPSGSHRAFRMERDHFSKEWDDAPMPHSIFFTKTGHAIHGSLETKKIGRPASAGCVRLAPENAEKLFALVEERGVLNTTVVVSGDLRVALARANGRTARSGGEPRARRRAEPLQVSPDYEYYGERPPAGAYAGRGQPRTYYVEPGLDAYAARMRQRYQRERAAPAQRYYYVRPYYQARPYGQTYYYQRRADPFWD